MLFFLILIFNFIKMCLCHVLVCRFSSFVISWFFNFKILVDRTRFKLELNENLHTVYSNSQSWINIVTQKVSQKDRILQIALSLSCFLRWSCSSNSSRSMSLLKEIKWRKHPALNLNAWQMHTKNKERPRCLHLPNQGLMSLNEMVLPQSKHFVFSSI